MSRFRVTEYRRTMIGGSIQVHAHLHALRGQEWFIIGIFSLGEDEWQDLLGLALERGIEVKHAEES